MTRITRQWKDEVGRERKEKWWRGEGGGPGAPLLLPSLPTKHEYKMSICDNVLI